MAAAVLFATGYVSAAALSDTIKQPSAESVSDTLHHKQASDSLIGITRTQQIIDSLQQKFGNLPDSASKGAFAHSTYWSFAIGWRLGSQPFFSEWKNTLPQSSTDIVGAGSAIGNFTVKQSIPGYCIWVPLTVGITPIINDKRSITFEGGFNYLGKTFLATLADKSDSATQWIHWTQSCRAYIVTLGLSYRHVIPEQYFSIEKADKAWFLLGAGVCPIAHITTDASLSFHNVADSTVTAAKAFVDNRTYNGLGCTWKVGLGTLRNLSKKSGLEIDLIYTGGWYGNFRTGSNTATWGTVNKHDASASKTLSYITHAIEATFIFCTGKSSATTPKKQ
jgi:hypothetical protein